MQANVIRFTRLAANCMSELLSDLVEWFRLKGLTVSVVKHASDAFDLDQPSKDSFHLPRPSHAAAGITRVTE